LGLLKQHKAALGLLDQHKALNPSQHGFVKHKSCSKNLLQSHNKWSITLESDYGVDIIYLNYSKAFDSVLHLCLIQLYSIKLGQPSEMDSDEKTMCGAKW